MDIFEREFTKKLKIDESTQETKTKPDTQTVNKSVNKLWEEADDSIPTTHKIKIVPLADRLKSRQKKPKSKSKRLETDIVLSVNFKHSIEGMIIAGPDKGNLVEIRYVLPGNFEAILGINNEIVSSRPLRNGEIVNNCVVLARINNKMESMGSARYLVHCKKTIFLDNDNVKRLGNKNVKIIRGDYKGRIVEIVKYNEGKIGGLLFNNPIILNESQVFFKDILLKNGKFFQVKRIEVDGDGEYFFYGNEFGNGNEMKIKEDDIEKISIGFEIYEKGKQQETIRQDSFPFVFSETAPEEETEEELETTETEEEHETTETEEIEEEPETTKKPETEMEEESEESMMDFGQYEEPEEETERPEKSAFSDKMRMYYENVELTGNKKMYYGIIKKILDIMNIGQDDIGNIYNLVDEINNVLERFRDMLNVMGINFDILKSLIDINITIACMVAYKIISNGLKIANFDDYIKELYNNGIFVGNANNSVLLNEQQLFECNFTKTKIELEKIKMLTNCFNNELQRMLNLNINFRELEPINLEELIPIKRRDIEEYGKRKFSTIEDVKKGEISLGARKMVWSGKKLMKIRKIKERLNKNDNIEMFIYENIENAPILLKNLKQDIVELLFKKYGDKFMSEYNKCNEEKCKDMVISSFLKQTKSKNELVQKYKKLSKIVEEILNESDDSTTEENIRKRFKNLGIDNSKLIKRK